MFRCYFNFMSHQVEKKRTWIFDPLLTPDEKSIAYELGLEVIPENEVRNNNNNNNNNNHTI